MWLVKRKPSHGMSGRHNSGAGPPLPVKRPRQSSPLSAFVYRVAAEITECLNKNLLDKFRDFSYVRVRGLRAWRGRGPSMPLASLKN